MSELINLEDKNDEKIEEIAIKIKNGGIVVFPTETVYGIGTNGLDANAVKKIYKLKNRPIEKPISLLVSSMEMIETLTNNINEKEYKLMKKFFPGPLTIILEKSKIVPDIVSANTNTIGIRMPKCDIVLELIKYANVPIAAPSANLSGKPSGTNIYEIEKDFKEGVNYYIKGDESNLGVSSTVVKIEDGKPIILREGSITKQQIIDCLKEDEI